MNNIAFKQLELETLLEITNTLIEHEDVDDLLQDILIRTCGILDASCGFVLIEALIQKCIAVLLYCMPRIDGCAKASR